METNTVRTEADLLADYILNRDGLRLIVGTWLVGETPHAVIYKHIAQIRKAEKPLDVITLAESLAQSGELDSVGGLPYLGWIVSGETAH